MIDRGFWQDRRVLLTGHTGFKGAWLSLWFEQLGAQVFGIGLPPDTEPSLFTFLEPFKGQRSRLADIRDKAAVTETVEEAQPQIVIHMAAQSLVRQSYREPAETFATNTMGTMQLLDALRGCKTLQAVLVVTTDKVYRPGERKRAYVEDDALGGADPYSASKAAAELVTASMAASFFAPQRVPVATVRAGNVIGGGDWAEDRLVPDIWRALKARKPLRLRNPQATWPWQHVLDALCGYLMYAEKLAAGADVPGALNIGPSPAEAMTAAQVTDAMNGGLPGSKPWVKEEAPLTEPEAEHLALDPKLAMRTIGWQPRLSSRETLHWTADWYRAYAEGRAPRTLTAEQITRYEALA
jgi:CDP-glucose 4,6-dehydratase